MEIYTEQNIFNRLKGIIFKKTNKIFTDNSLVGGMIQSLAIMMSDLYKYCFSRTKNNLWLERLSEDELEQVGESIRINKIQPNKSNGIICIVGEIGIEIPYKTEFTGDNGITYIASSSFETINNKISISNIKREGNLAIAKSNIILNLSTGMNIKISNFTETNFNKEEAEITMISDYEFSYNVDDTGLLEDVNGILEFNGCFINVYSNTEGLETNISNGAKLSTEIEAITDSFVSFNGITGGVDIETKDSYLLRIKEFFTNNRNQEVSGKIIKTITTKFPYIKKGIVVYDLSNEIIEVISIIKVYDEDPKTRKITTLTKHNLSSGQIIEIRGSNHSILNITKEKNMNRFVGKIVDDFNFFVFVNDETFEDTTSNMSLYKYEKGIANIILYKENSSLTSSELNDINNYLEEEVLSFTNVYNLLTATRQDKIINVSNIVPNLNSLKNAITNNIKVYVDEVNQIGKTILKSQIELIISNSEDMNGNKIQSFTTDLSTDIFPNKNYNIINVIINFT